MRLICLTFFVLFSLGGSAQPTNAADTQDGVRLINLFSADMNPGVSCYRIPAIITANNGDLIATIDERVPSCGDLKWSNDINIVMRRSTDNGSSWSDIETIVDYPLGESASDPSMLLDAETGTLFLFFNYMHLDLEKDVYYFKMISSTDHGVTWSPPVDLTSQISPPSWKKDFKFITSGRGIQTAAGVLMHTMVNLDKGVHLFQSDDHGKNWTWIDTAIQPGDESKVVALSDGSLMVNSRVNSLGMRYVHFSKDDGQTWTSRPEAQIPDPGCNASIIRYSLRQEGSGTNRLLFSNANAAEARENLSVRISYDEGVTWSQGKTIYAGKAAYSSMTVLKNGDIGVFFEKDDYSENVFARFTLEWLTDGQDKHGND